MFTCCSVEGIWLQAWLVEIISAPLSIEDSLNCFSNYYTQPLPKKSQAYHDSKIWQAQHIKSPALGLYCRRDITYCFNLHDKSMDQTGGLLF